MTDGYKQPEPTTWRTQLRQWVLDPWVPLQPPVLQRNQALSFLLLLLLGSGGVVSLLYFIVVPSDPGNSVNLAGVLLIGLIYAVSRSGYQQAAVTLALVVATVPIYLLVTPLVGASEYMMLYLLIPITIAIFFLPLRVAGLIALANLVGMMVMALAVDTLSVTEMAIGPLSICTPIVLILLLLRGLNKTMVFSTESDNRVEVHYRQMMDFHPDMIAVHHKGNFLYINDAGVQLLGLGSADEIINQKISDYLFRDDDHGETATIVQSLQGDAFAMRSTERLRGKADSLDLTVEVTSMLILYDGVLATQLIVRDLPQKHSDEQSRHQLQTSYQNIVELMSDYTYECRFDDERGIFKLTWLSSGFAELTGYDIDDILANAPDPTLIHKDDLPIVQSHSRVLSQGHSSVIEVRIATKTGRLLWIRDYAQPIWDDTHTRVIGFTGTVQNITERAQAEVSLKSHALQQAVVAELGQRALGNPADWDTLMEEAVTLTAQVLNVDYCRVLELDTKANTLVVRSVAGWADDMIGQGEPLQQPYTQATYTLYTGEPVACEDITTDKRFKPASVLKANAVQSGISVVIHGQEKPIGILEGNTLDHRSFSLDDVNFIQSIANILAAFLEQQRTRAAEREQRSMVESLNDIALTINSTLELDEVLDRVLENLSQVLPYDAASIMVKREGVARIIRHSGHEQFGSDARSIYEYEMDIKDSPLLTAMVDTGKPLYLPDVRGYPGWNVVPTTEWIRSFIGAPIIFHGEPLGFINVDSAQLEAFTEVHADRLMAFASQVSIAIRNARRASELEAEVRNRTYELEVERRSLQSILEATGEGIIYTKDGKIQYANETFYQMTGYQPGILPGTSLVKLVESLTENDDLDPADLDLATQYEIEQAWATIAYGETWRGEMRFQRQDKTTFEAGLTISRVNEADGVLHAVTIMRDISQIKAVEAEQARFIAVAAHDLRNPVASLNTSLYMLERDPNNPKRVQRLKEITADMAQLIEDLLTISDVNEGKSFQMRDMVLQELLEDVVDVQRDNAQESKQITISTDFALDPMRVYADPTQLKRVMRNLISNSINYTQEGGQINVCLYAEDFANRQIEDVTKTSPQFAGQMAIITVQDNGNGIKPEDLEKIFLPMYRGDRNTKGTGLGLSISQGIVRKHGGEIRVESVFGEGSTFYVMIPLLSAAT